jgi:hypothetical protein
MWQITHLNDTNLDYTMEESSPNSLIALSIAVAYFLRRQVVRFSLKPFDERMCQVDSVNFFNFHDELPQPCFNSPCPAK